MPRAPATTPEQKGRRNSPGAEHREAQHTARTLAARPRLPRCREHPRPHARAWLGERSETSPRLPPARTPASTSFHFTFSLLRARHTLLTGRGADSQRGPLLGPGGASSQRRPSPQRPRDRGLGDRAQAFRRLTQFIARAWLATGEPSDAEVRAAACGRAERFMGRAQAAGRKVRRHRKAICEDLGVVLSQVSA